MPNYVLAYHGRKEPASPEEGAKWMADWKAWLGDLGDAVVNPGIPLGAPRTVSSAGIADSTGPNALTGITIVRADDMDAALEIAKTCPFLKVGTIEVAEAMEM